MKVNTQAVNFDADAKLIDFIQKRLDKLEQFYNKIINADVYLKVQKTSAPENKITEIRLFVPGDDMVVKKTCKTFEQCVDECAAALERQLKKRKEKLSAH
ncbi:putative sigma-54 modulation protein [Nonlabens dokdonensis]|jgi:putative sigma-54 modulation protein|uniref:Sigma-54 modulation protein-like ribosome-associated protein n=2 Tax=Nonlabens dokdonensis TaxID=328515 RepID=L7WE80_NONDD|nr:ribosome-associated translation inhibitor RaiA [Nonlabens dokdonensis]AGC77198.1 sigma-54 modulation protein-like ribosome-associated protein [Nonlabens dokdonensis DSW-6]OUS09525.1 ribosomal subunit interface protein [Nonlabens dokdonensis]PZX41155.1 putative sigma-54 modulation protein [Nonlabens dokdonensis]